MVPTGWVEAVIFTITTLLAVVTWRQWALRDVAIVLPVSGVIFYFSIDINPIMLAASITLIALSAYRLHILLHKTPRASVSPTPSE